ncbi:acetyl-CoA carboxylase biotin carboxylase subunit [Candidatus Atribacteria bacterium 4572_76]|nr:MAG: acetyl-CoA carboxylase biotin carboxylase subunit [Candidatus Atribacteria bacterium 4572_76]
MARVLIANRGEIAIRIMKACQALNLDFVIVYTEEDKHSLHVKLGLQQGGKDKVYRIASYTDPNEILEIADYTKCDAIHPGYGFLAENYRFARRVTIRQRPLIFIGPRWEVIRELGNKINTKALSTKLNIPVIPGSDKPIYNEIEAENIGIELFHQQWEEGIKNPAILVKASSGGGGMGIEEVRHLGEIRRVYRQVKRYAKRQFGDEWVLLEKKFPVFNHIEVQLVCSQHGERVHYSTRNCTIQSISRQKRIEVAPAFDPNYSYDFNPKEIEKKIIHYSLKIANYLDYDNVGTWEWIVTPEGKVYLLEVNPRIQVESGVSGLIAQIKKQPRGVDLIKEQIRLALGERLKYKQKHLNFNGVSIEFRLVAEDTKHGFKPWSGTINHLHLPQYEWLQVHTHVPQDNPYSIPTDYDPNLALALIWGKDIEEAKQRGERFLNELEIDGENSKGEKIVTNIEFLKEKLNQIQRFV